MSEHPEAGRALDARIHQHVVGHAGPAAPPAPPYSTDIAAAWAVLAVYPSRDVTVEYAWREPAAGRWWCGMPYLDPHGEWVWATATAPTAPLAICRAMLQTLEAGA